MILYDAHKKLIAINEQTLEMLGYSSLEEFKKEIFDVAQLFIKKAGYIHQFKSFHWIDYILTNTTVTHRAILQTKDNRTLEVFVKVSQLNAYSSPAIYYLVTFELNTFHECEPIIAQDTPHTQPNQPESKQQEVIEITKKEFPPLEIELIAQELNLDKDIVIDFIKEYISHALEKLEEINKYINSNNLKSLYNTIHTLKGVAANLRLKPAFEILSQAKKDQKLKEYIEIIKEYYSYILYLAEQFNVPVEEKIELKIATHSQIEPTAPIQKSPAQVEPVSCQKDHPSYPPIDKAAKELGLSLNEYQEYLKELINEIKLNLAYNNYSELHKLASFARNLYLQECAKYLDQVNIHQNPALVKKCIQDLEELKNEPNPFTISLEDLKDSLELTQIQKEDFIEIIEDLIIELKTLNNIKMRKEKFLKKAKQLKSVAESLRLSNLVLLLNNIISNYPMDKFLNKQLQEAIASLETNVKQL